MQLPAPGRDPARPARRRPDRLPAAARRAELPPAHPPPARPAAARQRRRGRRPRGAGRRVPDLDRRRRDRGARGQPAGPRARRADPRRARRTRRRSSSASTGSTTPRASRAASRHSANCCRKADSPCPKTVMVQVATPSRERVEQYQALRVNVEREVGRINGDYGRVGVPAVHYLHQSYSRSELVALFCAADVMMVTPLRDGMNLVAKEYVAARVDLGGALVLSEFAGAAGDLRQAFLVNPYDLDGMKDTLLRAVQSRPDRGRPADAHDAAASAHARLSRTGPAAFLDALTGRRRIVSSDARSRSPRRDRPHRPRAPAAGRLRLRRHARTDRADPSQAVPLPEAVAAIRSLAALPQTTVAVVSGRALRDLATLSRLPSEVHLVGSPRQRVRRRLRRAAHARGGRAARPARDGARRSSPADAPGYAWSASRPASPYTCATPRPTSPTACSTRSAPARRPGRTSTSRTASRSSSCP